MNKLFDLSFVGLKTGDAEMDAYANGDDVRLAIITITVKAQDFDIALELARKVVDGTKAAGCEARIWGVVEVDPEDEEEGWNDD